MSEPLQAKSESGTPLIQRVAIYAAVVICGFLLGFIPMCSSRVNVAQALPSQSGN